MSTFFYYLREVLGYIPFVCMWICYLYLLGLYKNPEEVASFYDKDRVWLRRTTYTVISLSFFICIAYGAIHLVAKSDALSDWWELFVILLVMVPILSGSAMAAIFLAALGDEERERLEKEKRYVPPYTQR